MISFSTNPENVTDLPAFNDFQLAIQGALQGLQCAATALILYSATKLNLSQWTLGEYLLATLACLAMFYLKAPLWLVLPLGGLLNLARRRWLRRL